MAFRDRRCYGRLTTAGEWASRVTNGLLGSPVRSLLEPHTFRPKIERLEARRMLAIGPLHVDIDSTAPEPDGLTWETAYVSLQDALDRAGELNNDIDLENDVEQIWIAEGSYTPTALSDADGDHSIDTDPRSATFSLIDGVSLYGGFAGGETTLAERQPSVDGVFPHETVLSGDLNGDDAANIATVDLLDDATRDDNAYTVVVAAHLPQAVILDGLTITGGNANSSSRSSYPGESGGAIYSRSSTLTITHSTLFGNSAKSYGCGIYNHTGLLVIDASAILGNSVRGYGGAIQNTSGTLTVSNTTISGTFGNGIHSSLSSSIITNSTIVDNSVSGFGSGGGISNFGGTLTLTDSTISGNSAANGGGIHAGGTVTITNSTISDNSARQGGGIHGSDTLTISNSTIVGNSSGHDGGGIYNSSGTATLVNSTISGNSAGDCGGGIYGYSGSVTLVNSTVSGNWGDRGAVIERRSGLLTIRNSIVAINGDSSDSSVRGSLTPESGFNLIDVDPGFARNPGPGVDEVWGTEDDVQGDFRLRFDSPAIDAGNKLFLPADSFDLDGDDDTSEPIPLDVVGSPRVQGDEVDIGAREGVGPSPRAVIATFVAYTLGQTHVAFDGTGSYDPNDDPLTYQWQIDLDGNGSYNDPGETVSTAASFDHAFSDPGIVDFQLTVSDGESTSTAASQLAVLSGPILLVDDDALLDGDGMAWTSAFDSLQAALDLATARNADSDVINDVVSIWIAEGAYIPTTLSDADGDGTIDDDPRSATFALVDGVSLHGGFAGNESTLQEREFVDGAMLSRKTILSGDLGGNDGPDIAAANLLDHATRQENAYTVIAVVDLTQPVTLDGLTITGGNASLSSVPTHANRIGGAIFSRSSTLRVINSVISGNSANYVGGGIYNSLGTLTVIDSLVSGNAAEYGGGIRSGSGTLTIANSNILDNSAVAWGGGISTSDGKESAITDSTFARNSADLGGGLYSKSSNSLTITNAIFSKNIANTNGGGIYSSSSDNLTVTSSAFADNSADSGGGIYAVSSDHFTLAISTLSGNSAAASGGGIFNTGGTMTMVDSTISDNSANDGGGVYSDGTLTTITSTISNNSAEDRGGGICNAESGTLTAIRSTISDNVAHGIGGTPYDEAGGGIYNTYGTLAVISSTVSGNSADGRGGGVSVYNGTANVTNSIISANSASSCGGGISSESGTLTVGNATVSGNSAASEGGGIFSPWRAVMLTNSLVTLNDASFYRNLRASYASGSGFNWGDTDPGFALSPGPGADAVWGTVDDTIGDFRLRSDSPVIDRGSTARLPADAFDLDGDGNTTEPIPLEIDGAPRVQGDQVDLGAHEGVGRSPRAAVATSAVYDVDQACVSFDGTASYDPSDDPLTYQWRLDLNGNGSYDDPGEAASTAARFQYTFSTPGLVDIQLAVSDGEFSHTTTERLIVLPSPILFVDDDALPDGDGTAWNASLDSLQTALHLAASRNTDADLLNDVVSIWIAEGT